MKTVLSIILAVVLLFGVIFGLQYLNLINFGFFAPKYANVQREVFEQNQSYVEGKRQIAIKYKYEYDRAKSEDDKEIIRSVVRQEFANFDEELLQAELRSFVKSCKFGK